jgi:hypothetical protein
MLGGGLFSGVFSALAHYLQPPNGIWSFTRVTSLFQEALAEAKDGENTEHRLDDWQKPWLDLLSHLLVESPRKRWTADRALQHPLFSDH